MAWRGARCYLRVRHHGTDVPLDLVEQPAPIDGGETRLPDQPGVAPFKEVPDETFLAKGALHLAGTIDDGLHHLHGPRGPMGWNVVSPIPWGFPGAGGRMEVLEPLRIHWGDVLHPARHPKSHHSTQDPVTVSLRGGPPVYGKRPSSATTFAMIRRGADDEKTPSKVR